MGAVDGPEIKPPLHYFNGHSMISIVTYGEPGLIVLRLQSIAWHVSLAFCHRLRSK